MLLKLCADTSYILSDPPPRSFVLHTSTHIINIINRDKNMSEEKAVMIGDVAVDEMTAMFSNLLKGGLLKQSDLVDNGFHDVSTKLMVDVSVNSAVGRALTESREARLLRASNEQDCVRQNIGKKGRPRCDEDDESSWQGLRGDCAKSA